MNLLTGANVGAGNRDVSFLQSVVRFFKFLLAETRKAFLNRFAEKVS